MTVGRRMCERTPALVAGVSAPALSNPFSEIRIIPEADSGVAAPESGRSTRISDWLKVAETLPVNITPVAAL